MSTHGLIAIKIGNKIFGIHLTNSGDDCYDVIHLYHALDLAKTLTPIEIFLFDLSMINEGYDDTSCPNVFIEDFKEQKDYTAYTECNAYFDGEEWFHNSTLNFDKEDLENLKEAYSHISISQIKAMSSQHFNLVPLYNLTKEQQQGLYTEAHKLRELDEKEYPWKQYDDLKEVPRQRDYNDFREHLIVFNLHDVLIWFKEFDTEWIELNLKMNLACVSKEGIDYEPRFFGQIIPGLKSINLVECKYCKHTFRTLFPKNHDGLKQLNKLICDQCKKGTSPFQWKTDE